MLLLTTTILLLLIFPFSPHATPRSDWAHALAGEGGGQAVFDGSSGVLEGVKGGGSGNASGNEWGDGWGRDVTKCPGYRLTGLTESPRGIYANLTLNGEACNAFGRDVRDLRLVVEYESEERLHVHIYDKDEEQYQIPENLWPRPHSSHSNSHHTRAHSDLQFHHRPEPFAFWITRRASPHSSAEIIFDTRRERIPNYSSDTPVNGQPRGDSALPAHPLIFEDQFLQLSSVVPKGANFYGLGEAISSSGFRRDEDGSVVTLWARDAGSPVDENMYGTHPVLFETRWDEKLKESRTHGIFLLNTHGMDVILREGVLEYRAIGGTMDLYFVSGPTFIQAIEQYSEIVGRPQPLPYYAHGFNLCRWGLGSLDATAEIVENMRKADIPLEVMWNDIDWMRAYFNFEFDQNFEKGRFKEFVDGLHGMGQHYVMIVDAAFAALHNESSVYDTYSRGHELDIWLKNPDGSEYEGRVWPGVTVFPDPVAKNIGRFWYEALHNLSKTVDFDGVWLDMNEPSSFCEGSCGSGPGAPDRNDVSVPFNMPGPTDNFPEGYDMSIGGRSGNMTVGGRSTYTGEHHIQARSEQHDDLLERDVDYDFPAYWIHNGEGRLAKKTVAPDAVSQTGDRQYNLHNVFGHLQTQEVNQAVQKVKKGKRPFLVSRSTFAGSGRVGAHWLGDNYATWASLRASMQGILQFQMFQIPMIGPDVGGFSGNSNEELSARWHALGAWYPFFRNHNVKEAISQEPYVWDTVADVTRKGLAARYSLLPYWQTLFADAALSGTPPVRAMFWEFDDPAYYRLDQQYMVGPALAVIPVMHPNETSVEGVLPRKGGITWRNWWTHELLHQKHDKVTLPASIDTIPVYIRSGSIILMHRDPGYTLSETMEGPYSLLVSLDRNGKGNGDARVDDGISLPVTEQTHIQFRAHSNNLHISSTGNYHIPRKLARITILGIQHQPHRIKVNGKHVKYDVEFDRKLERLVLDLSKGGEVDLNEGEVVLSW